MPKEILFSVTKDQFDFETMRGTGPGGQKRNKTESAVRCTHKESGATGFSDETRHQQQNRKAAFAKCVASAKFKTWFKLEVARRMHDGLTVEQIVDQKMSRPQDFQIEIKEDGKWAKIKKEQVLE